MAKFIDRYDIPLPKQIKSELNFIEKGIVSHNIDGELYFIYKNSAVGVSYYKDIVEIILEFDPILRDEFPSVRMIIRFIDEHGEMFNIDYYFSVESRQEVKHLYDLGSSKNMNIVFYDNKETLCSKFTLNNNELTRINEIVTEINT